LVSDIKNGANWMKTIGCCSDAAAFLELINPNYIL